jgi:AraC-like DNA-binding protein
MTGQVHVVLPRGVILLPSGAPCCVTPGGGADLAQVAFIRSILDPDLLGDAAEGLLGMFEPSLGTSVAEPPLKIVRLLPAAFDEARALFGRLEAEARQSRAGREAMQRLVLVEILLVIYRCLQAERAARAAEPARLRVEDVEAFVRERYAEGLSLASLAARFGFNPSYLSRLFSARTGVHLTEYINRVRIQKSCALLKRSAMGIVEIAFAVGYNNRSHFDRYFRRITGMSPREYRNRSRK